MPTSRLVPLVQFGTSSSYGVAYAFSETAEITVALVDTKGSVTQPIVV